MDAPTPMTDLDLLRLEVQRTGNLLRAVVGVGDEARACVVAPRPGGGAGGALDGVTVTFDDPPGPGQGVVDPSSPLFAHAPIAMGIASLDGSWVEVNQALCALTGRDRAELAHMTLAEVTAPEDRHLDFVYLRQLLSGELTGYQLDKRWRRADGSEVWVLLAVSSVTGIDGGPDHLVVQAQDITARREAETRMRMLADLVDCSAEAIWARDGGGEVVYWNRAAAQLLGYEAEDLCGWASGADLPESRVAETAKVLAMAAGGRSVGPLATTRRHKDGHDVEVSLTVSPILGEDGSLVGFASVARRRD